MDGLIDACCLINLFASKCEQDILRASGYRWYIAKAVVGETLKIRRSPPNDEEPYELIDLKPILSTEILTECSPTTSEVSRYVELAHELDDGEAMSLAIAVERRWVLATDDRKAIRMANALKVRQISTLELIENWARASQLDEESIREIILRIESSARFVPRRDDPLHGWWSALRDAKTE